MTTSFDPADADTEHQNGLFDLKAEGDKAVDEAVAAYKNKYPSNFEETPSYEYDDETDDTQSENTMGMTIFFVVLLVLYLGFCMYYQKVKTRRSVGDYIDGSAGESNGRTLTTRQRQQQRRENQVVLDESISATSRARENAEEQTKLEERKLNIKKVLLLRLIVEEEEDGNEKKKCCNNGDCGANGCDDECEQCQYWKWENSTARESKEVCLAPKVTIVASAAASNASKRGIISVQEDEDGKGNHLCEMKLASTYSQSIIANTKDDEHDIEEQNLDLDNNENEGVTATLSSTSAPSSPTVSPLSPPHISPRASPRTAQLISLPASTSPSRLSLSSPKQITNALNCGSRRSFTDALNCASNNSRMNCSNHTIDLCSSIHSANCSSSSRHGKLSSIGNTTDTTTPTTIPLSAIISTYGEECNICLSQFQVGDRAAWSSKLHCHEKSNGSSSLPKNVGNDNDRTNTSGEAAVAVAGTEAEQCHGCKHVFHEECISRWLLVRDGCPICRRSYFTNENGNSGGDQVDLERGENI
eukprot:CAMPEP_0172312194 /NCGR_PEP_ID=MMETSP1058-20130122/17005_1 /TAXON_ID=83371 /ORGANISM="Detonula confervacea, Strain CCMP 353" /LENGTH=528 /DNA_ID=CAMNT_0013025585 /DNA_START=277 /DNA_END=1863 /DNA_ORIENTATION=-